MVVGFITTCAISALNSWEMCSIQRYVITFVSDLRLVGGFLWVLRLPPPKKTDSNDIAEKFLKVALNTIHQTKPELPYAIRHV